MALPRVRFRGQAQLLRRGAVLLGLALALPLSGCGAVEAYRSVTGINRNDPDPQTALFTKNLDEAQGEPYPNLASVPPPPTRATTTAERQKLADALVADRAATAASGGSPPAGGVVAATAKPTRTASLATAAPTPGAGLPEPGAASPGSPAVTAPPNPNAPATPGATTDPAATANAAAAKTASTKTASSGTATPHRNANEPPEPGPPNSSLQMPDVRSVPEPESMRPPPAPPALGAVTPAAPIVNSLPASVATMAPAPAPAVPVLGPVAPPPTPATPPAQRTPPPAATVATLDIPGHGGLDSLGQAQVDRVAALYKNKPTTVRVVARAAPPVGGGDPLASYHAALGSAQAVAEALKAAGVPANKIQTEATPGAGANAGRIEIQFAP